MDRTWGGSMSMGGRRMMLSFRIRSPGRSRRAGVFVSFSGCHCPARFQRPRTDRNFRKNAGSSMRSSTGISAIPGELGTTLAIRRPVFMTLSSLTAENLPVLVIFVVSSATALYFPVLPRRLPMPTMAD